jgi:hypothetical protein
MPWANLCTFLESPSRCRDWRTQSLWDGYRAARSSETAETLIAGVQVCEDRAPAVAPYLAGRCAAAWRSIKTGITSILLPVSPLPAFFG